jgi:glycosyltransferase involved in cell wall biosynthesis
VDHPEDSSRPDTRPLLSVIIPARNEQDCIAACLQSLISQSEEDFHLGRDWEILVVDDASTDQTRSIISAIAATTPGVHLLDSNPLRRGWTGKANAVWTAAKAAQGKWLLFTDADTIHEPGNLQRAIREADRTGVAMLSYSPRQIVTGFCQRALMPLVFSELALAYPPAKVSDPASRLAAANGQFILIQSKAYFEVGGHEAVADSLLEDVALARIVKRRKLGLRFRYAPEALSTRMYRSFGAMIEGWTKNLALLFGNAFFLAGWRMLDVALIVILPLLMLYFYQPIARVAFAILWLRTLWRVYSRAAKSNFPAVDCALSVLGIPLFSLLLIRSWLQHTIKRRVSWKGRTYPA